MIWWLPEIINASQKNTHFFTINIIYAMIHAINTKENKEWNHIHLPLDFTHKNDNVTVWEWVTYENIYKNPFSLCFFSIYTVYVLIRLFSSERKDETYIKTCSHLTNESKLNNRICSVRHAYFQMFNVTMKSFDKCHKINQGTSSTWDSLRR